MDLNWNTARNRIGPVVPDIQGNWIVLYCSCVHCGDEESVEVEIDTRQQGALTEPVQCFKCKRWMRAHYVMTPTVYIEELPPEKEPIDDGDDGYDQIQRKGVD